MTRPITRKLVKHISRKCCASSKTLTLRRQHIMLGRVLCVTLLRRVARTGWVHYRLRRAIISADSASRLARALRRGGWTGQTFTPTPSARGRRNGGYLRGSTGKGMEGGGEKGC